MKYIRIPITNDISIITIDVFNVSFLTLFLKTTNKTIHIKYIPTTKTKGNIYISLYIINVIKNGNMHKTTRKHIDM